MKVEIYGNSVASACAALKAYSIGHEVTWFCKKNATLPIRPVRLATRHLNILKEIERSHRRVFISLLNCREIGAYTTLSVSALNDPWKKMIKQVGYWIDGQSLLQELKSTVQQTAIRFIESEIYPKYMGNTANFIISDTTDAELNLWNERLFYTPRIPTEQSYCQQILFTKNPRQKPGVAKTFNIGKVLGFIEPIGQSATAMSLYSDSKAHLEEISSFFTRKDRQSQLPLELQILFTLNSGALMQKNLVQVGLSSVIAPGLFPIGSSIGQLCPENNQQDMLALDHLIELNAYLHHCSEKIQGKVFQLSERWTETKRRQFKRHLYLTKLWKKALLSRDNQRIALSAHSLMPPFLRQSLASPL